MQNGGQVMDLNSDGMVRDQTRVEEWINSLLHGAGAVGAALVFVAVDRWRRSPQYPSRGNHHQYIRGDHRD
ncbi:hemolysin III family channel protein, partial [Acidithiobacillus sp. GGI-221]